LMGFDLRKYYEKSLFFIHLKGRNFKKMIEEQLPQLVKARADYNIRTRVVIDPMTPVIWATAEKLEQRELIGKLFYTLKELGVVLCTVEEHAKPGETIGEDVLLPIYLSDGAVHLEYYPIGGAFNRTLKLLKMRGVHHGEGVYPYLFARGVGIVVRSSPTHIPEEQSRSHIKTFDEAIKTAEAMKAPARVIDRIKKMQKHWDYDYSPEEALQILFSGVGDRAFLVFLTSKPVEITKMQTVLANVVKTSIVVRHLFESKPITPEVLASYDEAVAGELKRLTRILFVEKFGETKEFKKNKEIAQYLQTKLGALVGPGPLQEIVTMAYNEVGTTAPYMTASHWDRFLTELVDRLREIKGDTVAAKAEKEWRAYLKQVLASFV